MVSERHRNPLLDGTAQLLAHLDTVRTRHYPCQPCPQLACPSCQNSPWSTHASNGPAGGAPPHGVSTGGYPQLILLLTRSWNSGFTLRDGVLLLSAPRGANT
jgi:hypothetical protein